MDLFTKQCGNVFKRRPFVNFGKDNSEGPGRQTDRQT